jgi:hypothetical protein
MDSIKLRERNRLRVRRVLIESMGASKDDRYRIAFGGERVGQDDEVDQRWDPQTGYWKEGEDADPVRWLVHVCPSGSDFVVKVPNWSSPRSVDG